MDILDELQARRLGFMELFSLGWLIYLKNFKSIIIAYCLTSLPFLIGYQLLFVAIQDSPSLVLLIFLPSIFILNVAGLAYYIAVAIITENFLHKKSSNPYQMIYSRLLPLFRLSLRVGVGYFLRFLLLIVPGIIYLVRNTFFGLALILRDQRGKAALDYSVTIVDGNGWFVFALTFVPLILTFLLQYLLASLLGLISSNPILIQVLAPALSSILVIGFGISGILLFINLEYQKGMAVS